MIVPAKRYCDICGERIDENKKPVKLPFKTDCNWAYGDPEEIHIEWDNVDICDKCLLKSTILLAGYQGVGKRIEQPSVCDNCVYNPPSSGDGKPCTLCPAQSRYYDE